MSKKYVFTDKEIREISDNIGKSSYDFMRRRISKEFVRLKKNGIDEVEGESFMALIFTLLTNLHANALIFFQNINPHAKKIPLELLMKNYIVGISKVMKKYDEDQNKERLN